MKRLKTMALAGAVSTVLAGGMLAASVTPASAEVVCNQWNDCWHVRHHFSDYPNNMGVVYHDDGWRGPHVHWRANHFGDHGYYRNGIWIRF